MTKETRMCGRAGCSQIGQPVEAKRCVSCGYTTLEWDEARARVLQTTQGGIKLPEDAIAVIADCRVLGGHGLPPTPPETWTFVFRESELLLRAPKKADVSVPYKSITAIEIGGPGARKSGGSFFGGGFGVAGAAEGMLIASALNLVTSKTTISTVLCLQTTGAELFAHNSNITPDSLRMRLSPVFTILRGQEAATVAPRAEESTNTIDRLAKLSELLDRGLIDDGEFKRLKSELLT